MVVNLTRIKKKIKNNRNKYKINNQINIRIKRKSLIKIIKNHNLQGVLNHLIKINPKEHLLRKMQNLKEGFHLRREGNNQKVETIKANSRKSQFKSQSHKILKDKRNEKFAKT